jgi:hypothetical protein
MTGLEQLIVKVSNATTQAMMGHQAVVNVESWSLEQIRQAALEDSERDFDRMKAQRRRMVRYSCE